MLLIATTKLTTDNMHWLFCTRDNVVLISDAYNTRYIDSSTSFEIHLALTSLHYKSIVLFPPHPTSRVFWHAIQLEIIEILVNFGADIMAETTSGETVFDICDDLEMHARLMEIKEEAERKQFQQEEIHNKPDKPRELSRRRSSTNPRRYEFPVPVT